MTQVKTKIGEGGRIVIPAEYRQALGLQVGDEVILRLEGRELRIFTLNQAIRRAQELVSRSIPQERSLADELIAERRREN
jgi:AbrB family looped-hinge helix DNA binding protein